MNLPVQSPSAVRNASASIRQKGGIEPSVCVSATVQGGQACINTPIGNECIGVPSWVPNGTAASACLDVCTHFGVPTGVTVTLTALGQQIAQESFGFC